MMKKIRIWVCIICMAVVSMSGYTTVYAEKNGIVTGAYSDKTGTKLILEGAQGTVTDIQCSISGQTLKNDKGKQVVAEKVGDSDEKIKTMILVDTSLSINDKEREVFSNLLFDMIDQKSDNESFCIATFGKEINYLTKYIDDKFELVKAYRQVENTKQTSYLTDIVYQVISDFEQMGDTSVKRLVVFSDGFNSNKTGVSMEKLCGKLEQVPFPIYTIGCKHKNNTKQLKKLMELSKFTGGTGISFSGQLEYSDLLNSISAVSEDLVVDIKVPTEFQDGTAKPVALDVTTDKGSYHYEQKVAMNTAKQSRLPAETKGGSQAASASKKKGSGITGNILFILLGAAIMAVLGGILFLILGNRSKKQKKAISRQVNGMDQPGIIVSGGKSVNQDVPAGNAGRIFTAQGEESGGTVVLNQSSMAASPSNADYGATTVLGSESARRVLGVTLADIKSGTVFSKDITGEIILGRIMNGMESQCIMINYDTSISKAHCKLYESGQQVVIEDLGSANGTFVNSQRIFQPVALHSGDIVKVGQVELEVQVR